MPCESIAKRALQILLCYCLLVIVWQLTGVALMASGYRALGPSASLAVAGVTLAIAAGLVMSQRYLRPVFYVLCAFLCWGAASTIVNAFTADPSLWPSDVARYAGVAINVIGVVGALVGLAALMLSVSRRIKA